MIQHVAVPVPAALAPDCEAFYRILGFAPVAPPPSLEGRSRWLAAGEQQVHLLLTDEDPGARLGHVALHVPAYGDTLARLRAAGHRVDPRREHWGAPARSRTTRPGTGSSSWSARRAEGARRTATPPGRRSGG